MDQLAREDIAAAAAVHQELGRDYDGAVAEGLVERIGAEIDKRVDARLDQRRTAGRPAPSARQTWGVVALGLGSMGIGIGAAATILNANARIGPGTVNTSAGPGQLALVALVWLIIGVINVAYARRR